jgi:ferredoxin
MSLNDESLFEAFLGQHDGQAWAEIVAALLPSIHEVDRTATQIWFAFFPVELARAMKEAADPEKLAFELQMLGKYDLKDQIDTSHAFLYGHRFWPQVKNATAAHASSHGAPVSLDVETQIRGIARQVAGDAKVDLSLVLGITAVAFMTLQQVGHTAFAEAAGKVSIGRKRLGQTPEQVLRRRAGGDSQGIFGFLKGVEKTYSIAFDEDDEDAKFKLISGQELTTAAANDQRHFTPRDPRLLGSEGPIPVQCRAAACGTCWVGILGGAEKLSDVERFEGTRIKDFGYINTDERKPLIRLACRAQAYGAVSIVIPPWNGVFGKYLRERKAASLREGNQTVA